MLLRPINRTSQASQDSKQNKKQMFLNTTQAALQRKIKRRNQELIKLFKPCPPKDFNLETLENSELMKNNQTFAYLVKSIKKERQGIFNIMEQDRAKDPKPIENSIRQFLFNSLQEAVLMPEKQLKQTKFLERLFEWFMQVFKEREVTITFKKQRQNKENKEFDQDWSIRNNYQSNMPLEIDQYQRKMISSTSYKNAFNKLNQNLHDTAVKTPEEKDSNLKVNSLGQRKLFQTTIGPKTFKKSSQLFPALTQQGFYNNTSKIREERQKRQIDQFSDEFKKSKASFGEHTAKNFYMKKFVNGKIFKKSPSNESKNCQMLINKIDSIRLGVTLTSFKKSQNQSFSCPQQSAVFHPFLDGKNFSDIKKKRIQKLQGQRMMSQTAGNFYSAPSEKTNAQFNDQGSIGPVINQTITDQTDETNNACQKSFIDSFDQNCIVNVTSIDGINLLSNPFDVKIGNRKKK